MNIDYIKHRVSKLLTLAINFPKTKLEVMESLRRINISSLIEEDKKKAKFIINRTIKFIEDLYPKRTA